MPESAGPLVGGGTIGVDRPSLKVWGMGHTGYSVRLHGYVGAGWIEGFRRAVSELGMPWRFYLDAKHGVIAFGCDRELTAKALDRLEEIVAVTNRDVARRASGVPAQSPRETEGRPKTKHDSHRGRSLRDRR